MVSDTISGEKRIPDVTDVVSVIAIQKGIKGPDRYAIMAGDIDSQVSDVMDASSDSPWRWKLIAKVRNTYIVLICYD